MRLLFAWLTRCRRQRLEQLFSDYVPPATIRQLEHTPRALEHGPVEFIFAMVQGSSEDQTISLIDAVTLEASRGGWLIQTLLCNLVVLVRGTLPSGPARQVDRATLIGHLLVAHGTKIRAVHGAELAAFGTIGGSVRSTYGVLLPSFSEIMGALIALPWAGSHDFSATSPPGSGPLHVRPASAEPH